MKKDKKAAKTRQVATIDDNEALRLLREAGKLTARYVRALAEDPGDTAAALTLGFLAGRSNTLVATHWGLIKSHKAELTPLLQLHMCIILGWNVLIEKVAQGENPFLFYLPWATDQDSDVFSDVADDELPCC